MDGDVSTRQEQSLHLNERITRFVEQVDEGYGKALIEQLIHRIELTVKDFVAEADLMVERLQQNAATREELLGRIKRKDETAGPASIAPSENSEEEVPEWEQRLVDLEGSTK